VIHSRSLFLSLEKIMRLLSPRCARSALLSVLTIAVGVIAVSAQVPPSNWVPLSTAHAPTPRAAAAVAYDPVSQKVVLFGGFGSRKYFRDTWVFDGTDWKRTHTHGGTPSGRAAAGIAFDAVLQKLVMYGGFTGSRFLDDTWIWDGATSTWTKASPSHVPSPETGPMLFPDPISGRVDNFGGFDGKFFNSTSWRWLDGDWQQLNPAESPSARGAAVCATNPEQKQTVLFGGIAELNPLNTWTFDGDNWTEQFPVDQIPGRFYASTTYDPRFHGVVVFAGFTGTDVNDTWLWSGSDWQLLSPTNSPSVRESAGIAFDEAHQQTIVFGGLSGITLLHDTWVLQNTN
jgi:Galactose oxidase, central domain